MFARKKVQFAQWIRSIRSGFGSVWLVFFLVDLKSIELRSLIRSSWAICEHFSLVQHISTRQTWHSRISAEEARKAGHFNNFTTPVERVIAITALDFIHRRLVHFAALHKQEVCDFMLSHRLRKKRVAIRTSLRTVKRFYVYYYSKCTLHSYPLRCVTQMTSWVKPSYTWLLSALEHHKFIYS